MAQPSTSDSVGKCWVLGPEKETPGKEGKEKKKAGKQKKKGMRQPKRKGENEASYVKGGVILADVLCTCFHTAADPVRKD